MISTNHKHNKGTLRNCHTIDHQLCNNLLLLSLYKITKRKQKDCCIIGSPLFTKSRHILAKLSPQTSFPSPNCRQTLRNTSTILYNTLQYFTILYKHTPQYMYTTNKHSLSPSSCQITVNNSDSLRVFPLGLA